MNEATLIRLKIIVERAIRPVEASWMLKREMREELLSHVTAVFDEEFAKSSDEQATLDKTRQRFGNPDEITGQLQRSVPAKDRSERFMKRIVFLTLFWVMFLAGLPLVCDYILLGCCLLVVGCIFVVDVLRRVKTARSLSASLGSRPSGILVGQGQGRLRRAGVRRHEGRSRTRPLPARRADPETPCGSGL